MADFNELIRKDGTRKSISVRIIPEDTNTYIYIPAENIIFESLKFTESVCSQSEFKFGCVEQSIVEFSLANYRNITGEVIQIYFYVYDEDGNSYLNNLGRFRVTESKKSADNLNIRKVIAMSDIDAPKGIVNVFKEIQRRLEKENPNYMINPELLIYGATKNPYSNVFTYFNFDINRYVPAAYTPYDKTDGTRIDFYTNVRIWETPKDLSSSKYYSWANSLFYFPDGHNMDYLADDVIKRVNDAVDGIISESGVNPPASFTQSVKKRLYDYLSKVQSFWEGLNRSSRYAYFIPSKHQAGYPSPFIDAFKLEFNGKEKIVYFLGNSLPFRSFAIYDTRYDKIKDINVRMNFDGLDLTNDEWMKKLRADWFNLTGRMSSNRISDMPYTATPMNLDSDALYPNDNLYPSDTLYPSGARNSYYAEDIKKFYADDEEDINRFTSLQLSFTDLNKVEHLFTRPFYKNNKEDKLIPGWLYSGSGNEVDIYLEGYTSQRWIMDSNVIKIYSDETLPISIEFLDKEDNVIGVALESVQDETGAVQSDGLYYKHIKSYGEIEYITSFHSFQAGYYVFESDKLLDTYKIRIKSYGRSIDGNYVKQHIKIYNEIFNEVETVGKPYVIDSNICLQRFNLNPGTIVYFADMLEEKLKNLNYMDISLTMRGNPSVFAGDKIEIVTKDGAYDSYVFRRTMNGIQSITDVIEAK